MVRTLARWLDLLFRPRGTVLPCAILGVFYGLSWALIDCVTTVAPHYDRCVVRVVDVDGWLWLLTVGLDYARAYPWATWLAWVPTLLAVEAYLAWQTLPSLRFSLEHPFLLVDPTTPYSSP